MRILSALLLSICSTIARAQGLEGPVAIFVSGDFTPPAAVFAALQNEADAIALNSSVRVSWHPGQFSVHPDVYSRLAVLRLHGECRTGASIPSVARFAKSEGTALGQTQTVNGEVLPIIDIQCDRVRQFLDRELRAVPSGEREDALGRALGRIVAHELYHVLLRTRLHAKSGLARPVITRADLLAPRQSFSLTDEQRLAEATPAGAPSEVGAR